VQDSNEPVALLDLHVPLENDATTCSQKLNNSSMSAPFEKKEDSDEQLVFVLPFENTQDCSLICDEDTL
jgi:hypothetical protein